jgi:RNA polymerase sigma-70 factor, ECF subfamily
LNQQLENIIKGCKVYNRQSQEMLYHFCYAQMFAVCERYTNNRDDACIFYNEGMLKVLANIEKFEGKGAFLGWVRKVIVNTCIDNVRKETNYTTEIILEEDDTTCFVNSAIEDKISSQEVLNMLQKLPKNTGLVFNLYAIEGFKFDEIATSLNITHGTAKWHVSEARKKLKQLLQEHSFKANKINA